MQRNLTTWLVWTTAFLLLSTHSAFAQWHEVDHLTMGDRHWDRGTFGYDVATDGYTLVVAGKEIPEDAGAHVYRRYGLDWVQEAALVPSDGVTNASKSVAVSGDWAFFGQTLPDNESRVCVFHWDGQTRSWTEVQVLQEFIEYQGSQRSFGYGCQIATDGNRLLVGQPYGRYDDSVTDRTSGYIYSLGANGLWEKAAALPALPDDVPGSSRLDVSLAGETAVIGTASSTLIYEETAGQWTEAERIDLDHSIIGVSATRLVGASGDFVGVSTYTAWPASGMEGGRVNYYQRDPGTGSWISIGATGLADESLRADWSVALEGSTIAAGVAGNDYFNLAVFIDAATGGVTTLQPSNPDTRGFGCPKDSWQSAAMAKGYAVFGAADTPYPTAGGFGRGEVYLYKDGYTEEVRRLEDASQLAAAFDGQSCLYTCSELLFGGSTPDRKVLVIAYRMDGELLVPVGGLENWQNIDGSWSVGMRGWINAEGGSWDGLLGGESIDGLAAWVDIDGDGSLGEIDYSIGQWAYNSWEFFDSSLVSFSGFMPFGQNGTDLHTIDLITITPEPATVVLLVAGGVLALLRRRRPGARF